MKEYLTIDDVFIFDFVEKKSKFKGALYPVASADEASAKLAEIKKQYWDATHNCSAMVIGEDKSFMRFSDDGEPQGTAGVPMLEVLKNSGVTNILAIATRYFGGVLLGAGGLVRAYTKCVSGALKTAKIAKMIPCESFEVVMPYTAYGKFENMILSSNVIKDDIIFAENVTAYISVPASEAGKIKADITEAFSGQVTAVATGEKYAKQYIDLY